MMGFSDGGGCFVEFVCRYGMEASALERKLRAKLQSETIAGNLDYAGMEGVYKWMGYKYVVWDGVAYRAHLSVVIDIGGNDCAIVDLNMECGKSSFEYWEILKEKFIGGYNIWAGEFSKRQTKEKAW